MFNLKKKIETKVEEVKTDITDNLNVAIIGAAGAITLSYIVGYVVGGRRPNSNIVNVTIVERQKDLVNNIILNNNKLS